MLELKQKLSMWVLTSVSSLSMELLNLMNLVVSLFTKTSKPRFIRVQSIVEIFFPVPLSTLSMLEFRTELLFIIAGSQPNFDNNGRFRTEWVCK